MVGLWQYEPEPVNLLGVAGPPPLPVVAATCGWQVEKPWDRVDQGCLDTWPWLISLTNEQTACESTEWLPMNMT